MENDFPFEMFCLTRYQGAVQLLGGYRFYLGEELHCTTLNYTELHYTTPLYFVPLNTTLHHLTLHRTTLHYTAIPYTTQHHSTLHHSWVQLSSLEPWFSFKSHPTPLEPLSSVSSNEFASNPETSDTSPPPAAPPQVLPTDWWFPHPDHLRP